MIKNIFWGMLLLVAALIFYSHYESDLFNRFIAMNPILEMNISVNEKAPVVSMQEITITAPSNIVWEVLTDIENWPTWQKNVTKAKLLGELNEGTAFKWKAGGIAFYSRIHTKKENMLFGWTGKAVGANAIHNWWFEETGDTTVIKVEESLQGILPGLFKSYFQKNLDIGMKEQLDALKNVSEMKYKKLLVSDSNLNE